MPSTFGDAQSKRSSGKGIASPSNPPPERTVESTGVFLSKLSALLGTPLTTEPV